jgi:hypothetical protein
MSSALPEPDRKFTASFRIVKSGVLSTTSSPAYSPSPIHPGSSGAGLAIGWTLFRLLTWATVAAWMYPPLLGYIGGEGVASWLLHHTSVRMLGMLPLGFLALITMFRAVDNPQVRAAREELASSVGASLVEVRGIDSVYGMPSGPGLRMTLGRWSMDVSSWTRRDGPHTLASVTVKTPSSFSFVARGAGREPAMLRGLQNVAMTIVVRNLENQPSDPRAAALAATMGYIAGPPIATGNDAIDRAMVLRANQPDAARALFTASDMAAPLAALNAKTRNWEWTLYPAAATGTAELKLACPGALSDAESLRVVRDLMGAALEEMARAGVIE